VFGLWGCFLVVLAAVDWLIFAPPDALQYAMPAAAAAGCGLLALVALLRPRAGGARRPERVVVLSYATVVLTLGLAAVLVGFEVGTWLCLLGGGVALGGLLGLVREWRQLR
jgi:hypothetical protein